MSGKIISAVRGGGAKAYTTAFQKGVMSAPGESSRVQSAEDSERADIMPFWGGCGGGAIEASEFLHLCDDLHFLGRSHCDLPRKCKKVQIWRLGQ